jgi:hypothetical protein
MFPVVLVLCLMAAAFVIVALLTATRPSVRPDVVDGVVEDSDDLVALDAELAAEGFVAAAPDPAAAGATEPPAPVIDD